VLKASQKQVRFKMPPENNNNINNTSKRSYVSNMESLRTSGMQALSEFNGD